MKTIHKHLLSALLLICACVVSGILAFGNYYYFQFISNYVQSTDAFLSALIYSAFLLVIGAVVVLWRPKFYGFQIGSSLKKWWLTPIFVVVVALLTILALSFTERTPYSGANWAVEMILVPLTEEMMWRGVLFSLLFLLLGKLYSERTSGILTVIFSSIAFGLAHSSNMLVHPVSFVVLQMIFASVMGLSMGYIRLKTKSIYPAMILHAAFNLVAILY